MKRCKKCGEIKSFQDFYRDRGMQDGYRNDCKACNAASSRARYQADPAAAIARVKRWQQDNPERLNAYRRARREEPDVKRRERANYLKRKHGITIEEYEAMLERQGGVCAICGATPSPAISLHVDHNHRTGEVRGLLCFVCNSSLGDFDDIALLQATMRYLDTYDKRPREPELEVRLVELKKLQPAWAARTAATAAS